LQLDEITLRWRGVALKKWESPAALGVSLTGKQCDERYCGRGLETGAHGFGLLQQTCTLEHWQTDCFFRGEKQIAAPSCFNREARLQFTIESRQLTLETTRRSSMAVESKWMTIEAANPDDAISQFLDSSKAQLVSFLKPADGRESIATVRKDDSVFLVRIYEA
jgi:hypothetical protein